MVPDAVPRAAAPGSGTDGAGSFRAGGGNQIAFAPTGRRSISGTMFGMRRWLPLAGGGRWLARGGNQFLVHRRRRPVEQLDATPPASCCATGDWFEIRCPTAAGSATRWTGRRGGGGRRRRRPVLRRTRRAPCTAWCSAGRRRADRTRHRRGAAPAAAATGRGAGRRRARRCPVDGRLEAPPGAGAVPLSPGVVQAGHVAYAAESGRSARRRARTTGPTAARSSSSAGPTGPGVEYRTYLDPGSGRALHVEVALAGAPRSFTVLPDRWAAAASPSGPTGAV